MTRRWWAVVCMASVIAAACTEAKPPVATDQGLGGLASVHAAAMTLAIQTTAHHRLVIDPSSRKTAQREQHAGVRQPGASRGGRFRNVTPAAFPEQSGQLIGLRRGAITVH